MSTTVDLSPPPKAELRERPAFSMRKLLSFDNRFLAPALITLILALAHYQYGILEKHDSAWLASITRGWISTYSPTFLAILATVVCELVLGRLAFGRWPFLASAYISGISVGILIKSPFLWPYLMCAALSIASKYALRVRGRHLWNPTNLGVTAMLFLAPATVAGLSIESGNDLWPVFVIWFFGALILGRLGRLHIPLTFALAYIPLSYLRSTLTGRAWAAELAPLTSAMYQLFMCFMITDPKTTTRSRWSQCVVVVLVAVMESLLRLGHDEHAAYHALFVVGPVANLIEIGLTARAKTVKAPTN